MHFYCFSNKDNKDNVQLGLKIVASSKFFAVLLFMNWSNFGNEAELWMQPKMQHSRLREAFHMVHTSCMIQQPVYELTQDQDD